MTYDNSGRQRVKQAPQTVTTGEGVVTCPHNININVTQVWTQMAVNYFCAVICRLTMIYKCT